MGVRVWFIRTSNYNLQCEIFESYMTRCKACTESQQCVQDERHATHVSCEAECPQFDNDRCFPKPWRPARTFVKQNPAYVVCHGASKWQPFASCPAMPHQGTLRLCCEPWKEQEILRPNWGERKNRCKSSLLLFLARVAPDSRDRGHKKISKTEA